MAYIRVGEGETSPGLFGCGPNCRCFSCSSRFHGLGQRYVPDEPEDQEPEPAGRKLGSLPLTAPSPAGGAPSPTAGLLSPEQIRNAVTQNEALGRRLGWGVLYGAISSWILNLYGMTPSPDTFARALANWQYGRGLGVDGILGPATWRALLAEAKAGIPRPYRTPEGVNRPHGLTAILAAFGDPTVAGWEARNIVRVTAPVGLQFAAGVTRLPVHRLLAPHFMRLFSAIQRTGLWREFYPSAGVYVCRTKKPYGKKPCGTPGIRPEQLSNHSWGIAIDFRAADYPYYTSAMQAGGVPLRYPPATLTQVFQALGFHWGLWFLDGRLDASGRINFAGADPMHFQFATGY